MRDSRELREGQGARRDAIINEAKRDLIASSGVSNILGINLLKMRYACIKILNYRNYACCNYLHALMNYDVK